MNKIENLEKYMPQNDDARKAFKTRTWGINRNIRCQLKARPKYAKDIRESIGLRESETARNLGVVVWGQDDD